MASDKAYREAEKEIEYENNHPRITTTNTQIPAHVRLLVTPFVDGVVENKGGKHDA